MIAIIDYGMGNLRSVEKGFHAVGHNAFITSDPEKVREAQRIVLPGVGAFGAAIGSLRASGMADVVVEAIRAGKPFLGICLGLQLLFTEGEEMGRFAGLHIIPGRVVQFFRLADGSPETERLKTLSKVEGLKVPHMGWNAIDVRLPCPLLRDVPKGGMVYFVHSYYVAPEDPAVVATTTRHGIEFCSAVWKDNIFASQFHPEKSGTLGLSILKHFGNWEP
jgi:imidazole glycerol-phosphate synthase subunit HisH